MSFDDLKLYTLNSFTMVISFSNVEAALKLLLLFVSIVYTTLKIIEIVKKKK